MSDRKSLIHSSGLKLIVKNFSFYLLETKFGRNKLGRQKLVYAINKSELRINSPQRQRKEEKH